MATARSQKDKHFPVWFLDSTLLRFLDKRRGAFCSYTSAGKTVADLGCGPGYFTLALADTVGPQGRVYAIDSSAAAIRALERKIARHGTTNIEARACSAAQLGFIADRSVDFLLAEGLLCSIAPQARDDCVREMHRILKPGGRAYLSAGRGSPGYMTDAGWEEILQGWCDYAPASCRIESRKPAGARGDYWAVVST